MHLSRVLSPVIDVLTPSLFAVRAPLFEAPAVAAEIDAVEALRSGGTLVGGALERGAPPDSSDLLLGTTKERDKVRTCGGFRAAL